MLQCGLEHRLQDEPGLHQMSPPPGLWTCSLCDYQIVRSSVKMSSLRVVHWLLPLALMSDGTVWMLNLSFSVHFSLVQFQAAHQALCNVFGLGEVFVCLFPGTKPEQLEAKSPFCL